MNDAADLGNSRSKPTGGVRVDKRRALLDGALLVFAADGFTRASIDAIAKAAGVSSRTIYNQHGDKASLFEAVIVDSAHRIAEEQVAVIRRHLGWIVDFESDLIEFGRAWVTPVSAHAPHFALVRQVYAEANHISGETLNAWQEAGPLRVRREIARHLADIAAAGHLTIANPDAAAVHLVQLATGDANNRSFHGAVPLPQAQLFAISDAGVRAFIYGHSGTAPRSKAQQ